MFIPILHRREVKPNEVTSEPEVSGRMWDGWVCSTPLPLPVRLLHQAGFLTHPETSLAHVCIAASLFQPRATTHFSKPLPGCTSLSLLSFPVQPSLPTVNSGLLVVVEDVPESEPSGNISGLCCAALDKSVNRFALLKTWA